MSIDVYPNFCNWSGISSHWLPWRPAIQCLPDNAGERGAWWLQTSGSQSPSQLNKNISNHGLSIFLKSESQNYMVKHWMFYGKFWLLDYKGYQAHFLVFFFFSLISLSLNRSCLYIYYFVSSHLGHPFIEPMAFMTKSIS